MYNSLEKLAIKLFYKDNIIGSKTGVLFYESGQVRKEAATIKLAGRFASALLVNILPKINSKENAR